MNALVWLPGFVLVAAAATTYFIYRDDLIEIGRTLHNQKLLFTSERVLAQREELPLLDENAELTKPNLRDAVVKLVAYSKQLNPDWIVGVHPGGRLLSVYVADRIGLDQSKCGFVRTDPDRTDRLVLELPPNEKMTGRLLLVDDISRTGDTLDALKWFFIERNFSSICALDRINFAVLLVVSDPDNAYAFRPDWVRFRTEKKWFRLPWTDLAVRIKTAFAFRKMGLQFSQAAIDQHEQLVSDYNYALGLARKYID